MSGSLRSTEQPAEAQRTLSQGTVNSSLPENASLLARQIRMWTRVPTEAEVPFSPSEEKLFGLWQKWGHEDRIPMLKIHFYEFFRWAKHHGFFTDVLYALDSYIWECMELIIRDLFYRGLGFPRVYPSFRTLFPVLKRKASAYQWIADCRGMAPFSLELAREEPVQNHGLQVPSPLESGHGGEALPAAEEKFFSAPLEHAPTEPLPPPHCSQGGDELAPLPEPEPRAPPQPAPQEVPVPAAPSAAPPQAGPDPPPPAEFVGVPVAEAPPPAASPKLLGDTLDSNRQELATALPLPEQSETTVQAAPVGVDPAPLPPPAAVPPPPVSAPPALLSAPAQHLPVPGEDAAAVPSPAGDVLPPALQPPPTTAAAIAAPAISLDSPPSFSGCPEAAPAGGAGAGEGDADLPLRGGVVARQLIAGSARLPAFKLSVFRGPIRVWFGGSRWGLECLTPPARPSTVGEVAPEPSASGPQPAGSGGGTEGQKGGTPFAFALQRQEKQWKVSIARWLWGKNIPRPEMKFLGKAPLPQLLICTSSEGMKRSVTRAAQASAAGCRVVRPWSLLRGPGLGRLARFPGPGPPPGQRLLGLRALLPPSGHWPPFCEPGLGSLILPRGPGPPQGLSGSSLLLLFQTKKKKKN
ncbi:proline-rich protein 36-like [Haemorhous mexicanus]|uniref:proline-rich protein 36-like n=1 Tax=Haemorhous mexicanus TaxID=30427 RepID=UPI0028BDDBE0|nr:proline-rich protein 36-like [Haemorhous mexicanus]XP_059729039.1 proline-rich protein 36-like [Haemorhous mexicanus]XP_059729040.1 proline-rich protein 36-like [Haemorhous mexicanus]XP_059729042.1 proline-rich protein 36-like [Haemorhous mexicanus]